MTPSGPRRRIGLLGGTFDPPHVGHLVVARDVLEALGLDEVRLVVAARPPHKPGADAPAEARARMVEACLAEAREPGLVASRVELEREGPSYTVDTLRALREREAGVEITLILGADQAPDFGSWKEPREIAELARLVVVARAGESPAEIDPGLDVDWETLEVTRLDVSSTGIRRRLREGRSVRWLVPGPALEIIEEEGLYA